MRADYRVRIFTPGGELSFAGHPTLGTAHALLDSGYQPKWNGRLVQQCGIGLVELAARDDGAWALTAPHARITPLPPAERDALRAALRTDALDLGTSPCVVNNGPSWLFVRLDCAAACLAFAPDWQALGPLIHAIGALGIAVYGPHPAHDPATFELRCLITNGGFGMVEDPVTGSANAALASLLDAQRQRPGPRYTVRQGTALGRDGRITIEYDDDARCIWVGGQSVTVVAGTFQLP
jgi:PhzF family phenazine biosynthesis protein